VRLARLAFAAGVLLLLAAAAPAMEDTAPPQLPSWVTTLPIDNVSVRPGQPATLHLRFKIADGYHINSHLPGSALLIPTRLQLNPPTDIGLGSIAYPKGHDLILAIAPDQPLNVYTGEFTITARVSALRGAMPGKYKVHGGLKYQACNDRACFPPKLAPVEFEVAVLKPKAGTAQNPAQSPHAHN